MSNLEISIYALGTLIFLALVFDFMNGFHDAANAIATVVSTGVLKPAHAVLFAAAFNFIAIFIFHLSVAATVGKGIVDAGVVDTHVVFGALVGAITWNVITWYYGIPSSSSHALIGGLVGAAVAKAGTWSLVFIRDPEDCRVHLRLAAHGHVVRRAADVRRLVALRAQHPPHASIGGSGGCSSSRPRSIAWAMAATTPRRRRGSSGCCSSPPAR